MQLTPQGEGFSIFFFRKTDYAILVKIRLIFLKFSACSGLNGADHDPDGGIT